MDEKRKIKCDILGLCETRRKKHLEAKWKDGSYITLGEGSGSRSVGGIGFIVSSEWSSKVIECTLHSSRTGTLLISIGNSRTLKIIQAYALTSLCEEEELEDFYLEVDEALKKKSTYTVSMGDFNAKIGGSCTGGKLIGRFCLGDRNDRGERLATFAETNHLAIANSFYYKKLKKRWTWISPNANVKNEIDYFLVDRKRLIQDVSVVTSFNTGSDHRLLRMKLFFNEVLETRKLQASRTQKTTSLNQQTVQTLVESEKWVDLEDMEEDYAEFIKMFKNCFCH
jgi:hypothetical protein